MTTPEQPPRWEAPPAGHPDWGPPPQAAPADVGHGRAGTSTTGTSTTGTSTTSTKAVVALVLAIAAYTPTVPFIGAIAALVVSRMAKRDILASGGTQTGLGLCRTANVLAVVHLVLVALLGLLLVALVLLPFSFV